MAERHRPRSWSTRHRLASLARVPPGGFEGIGLARRRRRERAHAVERVCAGVESLWTLTISLPYGSRCSRVATSPRMTTPARRRRSSSAKWLRGDSGLGKTGRKVFDADRGERQARQAERRVATVVGVVGDIKSSSLVDGLAEPYVYLPMAQSEGTGMTTTMSIVARSHRSRSASAFGTVVRSTFSIRRSSSSARPRWPTLWHWDSRLNVSWPLSPERLDWSGCCWHQWACMA